jgi:protein-disulfide isomerase
MVPSSCPNPDSETFQEMTPIPVSRILIAFFLFALLIGVVSTGLQFKTSGPETAKSDDQVVATVGNHSITLREVMQAVALPLYVVDQQRNQLLQQATQNLVDEELLAAEASRKDISVGQLLHEASQSESIARLANLPAPVKRLSPSLDAQEQARIRQALLVYLRRKADIHVALPTLEPPILAVSTDDDPRLGPDNAPVTIVEFSDFQCPYCQRSVPVLKELRRLYGENIRLIYRDYPGPNHPYASQAAEAAQCAGEQGKFWEYHDLLFDRQSSEKGWDFVALAREAGLQQSAFEICLSSGRFREEITKDLQDGLKLGITSTPTFFVNGRPLVGAQPLAGFQALIDRILEQPPHS